MTKTVLIAGGSGFLGAWTARYLHQNGFKIRLLDMQKPAEGWAEISGISTDKIDIYQNDISDYSSVFSAMESCDSVVNLAGLLTPQCSADPIAGCAVNLIGMIHIFNAAKSHNIDFVVYTSSAGVYGPDHADYPEPSTHYGSYKLACEGIARACFAEHQMSSLGLRPFVVYGPGREIGGSAGPSVACKMAVMQQPYNIGFSGLTGFVYAGDVARAIVQAIKAPKKGAHIANMAGITATVEQFVDILKTQIQAHDITVSGPGLPVFGALPDIDSAGYLASQPPTDLADGIAQTLQFYKTGDVQAK